MDDAKGRFRNLPDLPALENVELKNWTVLLALSFHIALILLFAGSFVWGYFAYRQYLPQSAVVMIAIVAALGAWAVLRLLFADLYYKTSPRGLSIAGLLRRRFIQWIEIKEADSRARLHDLYYTLRTNSGHIKIPSHADGRRLYGCELHASVWQHLRQCGKADRLELSPEALSLWDAIPDGVPREMQWQGKSRWPEVIAAACIAPLIILGGLYFALDGGLNAFRGLFGGMVVLGGLLIAWLFSREAFNAASRFSISEDGFEADILRRRMSVPWSDVTGAQWEQQHVVVAYGKGRRQVWVPLMSSDEGSKKLILALIRRLRTIGNPQALAIPSQLRVPALLPSPETQSAELRLAAWEKLLSPIVVILSSLAVFSPLEGKPLLEVAAGAALLLLYLACVRAAGTYTVRADDQGVSKQFLWWRKAVRWDDVASVAAYPNTRSGTIKRTLRNANGKTLIDAGAGVGSKREKEQFIAFIDAKLAQWLSDSGPNASWLARPYGS